MGERFRGSLILRWQAGGGARPDPSLDSTLAPGTEFFACVGPWVSSAPRAGHVIQETGEGT